MNMIYRNTLKKIRKSFGRYFSLMFIVLIGVGFFSGIRESAPDITRIVSEFVYDQQLMDYQVVSTGGLTDYDVEAIKEATGLDLVEPGYRLDVIADGISIAVHSIGKSLNQVELRGGRMPSAMGECLGDFRYYQVGDTITITSEVSGQLTDTIYRVVGTIWSPLYLAKDYGSTLVGDGHLDAYIYVEESEFNMESYSVIYLRGNYGEDTQVFSNAYQKQVQPIETSLKSIKSAQESHRDQEILEATGMTMESKWILSDRSQVIGYDTLDGGIGTIAKVASILPVFFILIVVLMTANTMARMIVEERSELGALVSLGYGNVAITGTYLFYVLSATIIGAVTGFFIGNRWIPEIIYHTFEQFILPELRPQYHLPGLLILTAMACGLMIMVTVFFCHMELKQRPAQLLRPVPPKKGQKILLERVGIIWKHLSFTWKVTTRNLFRYKQRVLMTVIGVAGCTALLVTGFGIKDSITGVAQEQYGEIFLYDTMMVLKGEVSSLSTELEEKLTSEGVTNPLLLKQTSITAVAGEESLDVFLLVPENQEQFAQYFHLTQMDTDSSITLDDNSVVITRRISEILGLQEGDSIRLKNASEEVYVITDVVENYIGNYIYMGKNIYEQQTATTLEYNVVMGGFQGDQELLANEMLAGDQVINVSFASAALETALAGNESLNNVVVLIVFVSILLVLIVLYNLTSINISERTREIATLKVLGFTDGESNQYIYRETLILTMLSIGIGMLLGTQLHSFVMSIMEWENLSYFTIVRPFSYVWSGLIIAGVTALMQVITYFLMKKINMIESLKSVE